MDLAPSTTDVRRRRARGRKDWAGSLSLTLPDSDDAQTRLLFGGKETGSAPNRHPRRLRRRVFLFRCLLFLILYQ